MWPTFHSWEILTFDFKSGNTITSGVSSCLFLIRWHLTSWSICENHAYFKVSYILDTFFLYWPHHLHLRQALIKHNNITTYVMDYIVREKGRDLTQSYDKSPYTNRNVKRAKWQHKQRHKKVRLNSGCATQLVWLTGLRAPPSH